MNPYLNAQLKELIQGSLSFSTQEKEKMIALLPTLSEEEKQQLMNVFMEEKQAREDNRQQYLKKIEEINRQYGTTIDPTVEIHKMEDHMKHNLEYKSVVSNVKEREERSKKDDNQEAEQLLYL
jgi:succinate dehydrogenase flavin-adding protein (antitoxin of CptAB toxin-antitoxin module)